MDHCPVGGPGVNWAITLTRLNATVAFPDADEVNLDQLRATTKFSVMKLQPCRQTYQVTIQLVKPN